MIEGINKRFLIETSAKYSYAFRPLLLLIQNIEYELTDWLSKIDGEINIDYVRRN